MELENQVCSLELAKKLKELGAEQKLKPGDCYFVADKNRPSYGTTFLLSEDEDEPYFDYIKAHSVAELGEMLPEKYQCLKHGDGEEQSWVGYYDDDCFNFKVIPNQGIMDRTEANCRAKMLIYLKENKLI